MQLIITDLALNEDVQFDLTAEKLTDLIDTFAQLQVGTGLQSLDGYLAALEMLGFFVGQRRLHWGSEGLVRRHIESGRPRSARKPQRLRCPNRFSIAGQLRLAWRAAGPD